MKNPGPLEAYEAIVEEGAAPPHTAEIASLRREFERRTGHFGPDDPWFEVRSRAFWDDAVTRQGFARTAVEALPEALKIWAAPFERAHRGLFRATHLGNVRVLVDVWSGAEFVLHAVEGGLRDALDAAAGLFFDGRLVARDAPLCVAMLPGALFHPPDASEAILRVLEAARATPLLTHDVLDALLRMEHNFRSLSRVKPAYAYRPDHLMKVASDLPA